MTKKYVVVLVVCTAVLLSVGSRGVSAGPSSPTRALPAGALPQDVTNTPLPWQTSDVSSSSTSVPSLKGSTATPTPTQTATPTATLTDTPTATGTPTATSTLTGTQTVTVVPTPTVTATTTNTVVPTPTVTLTPVLTATPTLTATLTPTNTVVPTPTVTATPTSTSTPLPPGDFSFGAAGDFGANSNSTATFGVMAHSNLDFVQALGDFSYGEKSEAGWCTYIHSFFGNTYPFELLSGNHESDGSTYSGLIDNFTPCLPDRFGNIQGTYAKRFYYDYPAAKPLVRFIMIDPALNFATGGFQDYSAGTANYNWVSSTIDAGRAAGIPWVIVGMHEVCLTTGVSQCQIGEDINNLLIRKKVDLVLQGHDHAYFRSKQLAINSTTCPNVPSDSYNSTTTKVGSANLNCVVNDGSTGSYVKGAGTVFVVDGLGGTSDIAQDGQIYTWRGDNAYFATWMGTGYQQRYGFMKYVVSPTSISAHFIGTTPTSTYSDQFTLTAGSSGGGPTASRLTWITAHRAGKTTVVRWRSPAMSVLGFNLFGAGHARPLNRTLIPARGLHHTYVVRVPGAYRLIQLEVVGRTGQHWRYRVTVKPTNH